MPEANNPDTDLWILVGIVAAIILFGLLVGQCIFINDFSSELRYLNSEIGRTTGESAAIGSGRNAGFGCR